MNLAIRDSLIDLLVCRADGAATVTSMVDWAIEALSSGLDTPSLAGLASLLPETSLHEADMQLEKALKELGPCLPDDTGLRKAYVGAVSRALIAGCLPHDVALDLIHAHAVGPLGHPPDLMEWCYLWERLDPVDFSVLEEGEAESVARRLAARWAAHVPVSPSADAHRGT